MEKNNVYTVRQLPSGFWSVWYGFEWISAAEPSKESAEKLAESLCLAQAPKKKQNNKR